MRYRTIVADPPWHMKAGTLKGREGFLDAQGASRTMAYPTMSVAEIAALPVSGLAERDAHLYLWVPNKYVEAAYEVARAWGFKPSTLLVWCKKTMGGGLGGTFGISTEFVLLARRGSLAANHRVPRTWFEWKRPYDERGKPKHSAKPPEFTEMVESVSPGPFLELFARERREGWAAWGNEITSDVELAA